MPLNTPITFCVYNRPALTRRVFESIARQQPRELLLIADGPRSDAPDDVELVRQTRAIFSDIDWKCNVRTLFREQNLGCRAGMAEGITWAFEQVERTIILEDDCLPDDSFYGYCEELLERYARDPRVSMISGNNFQPDAKTALPNSYYFSRWTHIWGWASWRRAWNLFDVDMKSWSHKKSNAEARIEDVLSSSAEYRHWEHVFDDMADRKIDTWDFAWQYANWYHNLSVVLPNVNLISNIGFGKDATHTLDTESVLANLPTHDIGPLTHPKEIKQNIAADDFTWNTIFKPKPIPVSQAESAPLGFLQRIFNRNETG